MRPAKQLVDIVWDEFQDAEPDLITVRLSLEELLEDHDRLERELRDAWLAELYREDGARIWIRDAKKKGVTIHDQLVLLERMRAGALT